MLGTSSSKRMVTEITERRGRVRALVTPPIYVSLDNFNGGLVFNISEDGLALTAARELTSGGFLTMRIFLPASEGWIEAIGEIAWRGKSKKEAGVRFVGLSEEACRRIGNWIQEEASCWEFREKNEAAAGFIGAANNTGQEIKNWTSSETGPVEFQVEKETGAQQGARKQDARQRLKDWIFIEASRDNFGGEKGQPFGKGKHIVEIAKVRASSGSILESTDAALISEEGKPEAICPADRNSRPGRTTLELAKSELGHEPIALDKMREVSGAPNVAERRAQARTLIAPPVYVNVENINGGLAFNMSEDGIALTAAVGLAGNHTLNMRIHVPDSKGWMDIRGQLAWRSESGKTAGIKFIGVQEDCRRRIRDWLAAESLARKPLPRENTFLEPEPIPPGDQPADAPLGPLPEILNANSAVEKRMLEAIRSGDQTTSLHAPPKVTIPPLESVCELQQEIVGLPIGATERAGIRESSNLKIANSGNALRRLQARREFRFRSRAAFHPMTSRIRKGKLRRLAAVLTLTGATAGGIGWIATHPGVRNEVNTFVAQNTEAISKTAELKTTQPASKAASRDVLAAPEKSAAQTRVLKLAPGLGRPAESKRHSAQARPQIRDVERPAPRSPVNSVVRLTGDLMVKRQPAKVSGRAAVAAPIPIDEIARSQVAQNLQSQPTENLAMPPKSPSTGATSGTTLVDAKVKENPPALQEQPAPAVAPMWSVAVSADPYPSLRMPKDIGSQKQSSSRSLQIGRVISSVDPIYPEEAKQEGIEGAVRLHVVVGRDGSVESVTVISGQASLAEAAMKAVREWRYGQTLLGGQTVETEQDIVVRFREVVSSVPKK
jgi:TonB family protein